MIADNFVNVELTSQNLDRYVIRTAILNAIKTSMHSFKGDLLDVGCGKMPYKEMILQQSEVSNYTGLDIETALEYDNQVKPDFEWDGLTMPFSDNNFNTAIATEVLEHCPDPLLVLTEINRVLKPGGVFFFTVPFLWPLHEVPHDAFRYTPFTLQRLLTQSGFNDINVVATGGWNASMAQMLGLWVRRSPMGASKRKLLSGLIKPLIKYLIKKDADFSKEFYESQMITGLYGTATKI